MEHVGTKAIETSRLILRRFNEQDAEEIVDGYRNQSEFLYYANKDPISLQEQSALLHEMQEKYDDPDYYNWLITLKATGQIVGSINLNVNLKNDSVLFNYAIDNRFTCKGYMTEALVAVKNFAFNEIKVNRFAGGCAASNIASKRVMEKAGLMLEGTLKDYIKLRDGYQDMFAFSLTRETLK